MTTLLGRLWKRLLAPLTFELDGFGASPRDRLTRVAPRLYLGAHPDPSWVPDLRRADITHVVSCLEPADQGALEFLHREFQHLFLGVRDSMDADIAVTFPRFFAFCAGSEAAEGRRSAVLVHCHSGVSRSPTLAIALLMKRHQRPFIDTYRAVRTHRSQILPNLGFATQLQRLEHELLPETRRPSPSSLARYLSEVCNVPADLALIQSMLEQTGYDAVAAIRTLFGGDIPRVVQGAKR